MGSALCIMLPGKTFRPPRRTSGHCPQKSLTVNGVCSAGGAIYDWLFKHQRASCRGSSCQLARMISKNASSNRWEAMQRQQLHAIPAPSSLVFQSPTVLQLEQLEAWAWRGGEEPMVVDDVQGQLRVQDLSQKGVTQIPHTFIRPPEERHHEAAVDYSRAIPVIDLTGVEEDSRTRERVSREIGQACEQWGFFQVVNHGIPLALLDQIMRVGAGFFALPAEEKLEYACLPDSFASEGYGNRMLVQEDQVLDWRDYVDHHTLPLSRRSENNWPDKPTHYRETIVQYSDQTRLLAAKLLALVSESLGLPASAILDAIGEPVQNVSINYYPACPQPDLTLGLQSHSDFGAITLLIQDDVGGLQVAKDGQWVAVPPIPHAIVVNLGDQMQILSNDRFSSVEHRAVVNGNRARMSVATFYDPSRERKIAPVPQLVVQGQRPRYREIVFGDHVTAWYSKGPYGKKNLASLAVAGG